MTTSVVMFSSYLLQLGAPHLDLLVVQAIGEGEVLAALASEEAWIGLSSLDTTRNL
jgi:hypothetical protein